MCTITPSPPAKKKTINNKDKNNMGNKKQVSFFDRVRIREIPLLSYDDEWSDDTSCDEDEYHDVDSEFEYQTDLERDSGEYHKALLPNNELEQRSSLSLKYSSNNHIVDFSGKIYSSSSSSSHHNSTFRPLDPQLIKTDRWKSTKANRWKSTTSPKSGEPPHAQDDQPTSPLKLPPSSPSKTSSKTRSAGSCSIDFHKRLGRKKKEGHYFQPPPSPQNKSYLPVSSQRRTSSTESLTRWDINSSNRGSTPGKYWEKTTSAPSLRRLRFNKSKNNVVPDNNINNLSLYGSRNATFGNTDSNNTSNSSNNRPPMLPSRCKTNNIFLNKINNSSNSSSSTSVKSNKKVYNFNSIVDSSSSNHTSSIDDTTSTSATTTAISTTPEKVFDIDDDDHYVSDTESSAPENDRDDNDNSPLVTTVPESPSGSTNRRSLLSRGFGSLRSLTSMSPLSRKHKGRNDLPPKRPIRLLSVRKLLIEDLS